LIETLLIETSSNETSLIKTSLNAFEASPPLKIFSSERKNWSFGFAFIMSRKNWFWRQMNFAAAAAAE
jgi:hypothetical protein